MFFHIPSINKSFNEVVWKYSGVYDPLQDNFDDLFHIINLLIKFSLQS